MRQLKINVAVWLLGLGTITVPASAWPRAWSLAPECPGEARQKAVELARSLKSAPPGSEDWLPYPFPQTAKEVFDDFAHQLTESWAGRSRGDVPVQERRLLGLLKNPSKLTYDVLPVAEWREQRCGRIFGATERILLLRLFERGSGTELGRFGLHESGLLETLAFPGDPPFGLELKDGHRLEAAAVSAETARRAALEPEAESVEYVALSSPTLPCYDTVPCVAFRQGARVFLYRSGELFELRYQDLQVATSELVREGSGRDFAAKAMGPSGHVVTLGGGVVTAAVPVERPRAPR